MCLYLKGKGLLLTKLRALLIDRKHVISKHTRSILIYCTL